MKQHMIRMLFGVNCAGVTLQKLKTSMKKGCNGNLNLAFMWDSYIGRVPGPSGVFALPSRPGSVRCNVEGMPYTALRFSTHSRVMVDGILLDPGSLDLRAGPPLPDAIGAKGGGRTGGLT